MFVFYFQEQGESWCLKGGAARRLAADQRAVWKITVSISHKDLRVNSFHSKKKLYAGCPSAAIHIAISTHENPSVATMKEHKKAPPLVPKQRYQRNLMSTTIPPPSRKQPERKDHRNHI